MSYNINMIDVINQLDNIKVITGEEVHLVLKSVNSNQLYYYIHLNDTNQQVGYCDLRTGHTESLVYYGNIGYNIKEQYRGNNYAFKATTLLLTVAKQINMDYLLITCSPENIASKKTIEKLGCEYIKTVNVPLWHPLWPSERVKRIYRIEL